MGSSKASAAWNGVLTIPDHVWKCTRTVQLNRYKNANGAGPVVLSDFFSRLRQRPDFNPNLRSSGAVDEIHVDLDPPRQWRAEIGVYSSRDFGRRERMLMRVLRPRSRTAALAKLRV